MIFKFLRYDVIRPRGAWPNPGPLGGRSVSYISPGYIDIPTGRQTISIITSHSRMPGAGWVGIKKCTKPELPYTPETYESERDILKNPILSISDGAAGNAHYLFIYLCSETVTYIIGSGEEEATIL